MADEDKEKAEKVAAAKKRVCSSLETIHERANTCSQKLQSGHIPQNIIRPRIDTMPFPRDRIANAS